jgi:hypothetical protein
MMQGMSPRCVRRSRHPLRSSNSDVWRRSECVSFQVFGDRTRIARVAFEASYRCVVPIRLCAHRVAVRTLLNASCRLGPHRRFSVAQQLLSDFLANWSDRVRRLAVHSPLRTTSSRRTRCAHASFGPKLRLPRAV